MKSSSKIVVSAVLSLLLLVAYYLIANINFPILENLNVLRWTESLLNTIGVHKQNRADSLDYTLVNTAFDKVSVPKFDKGRPVGDQFVSDRTKIADFLDLIKERPYKFIILDLDFTATDENNLSETEEDRRLADCILSMDRICIPSIYTPKGGKRLSIFIPDNWERRPFFDGRLDTSSVVYSAISAQSIDENNLIRMPLYVLGEKTIPLHLFEKTRDVVFSKKGPISSVSGRLCYNSFFVYDYIDASVESGFRHEKAPYLGVDYLAFPDQLPLMVDNRIVVIGDFDNDVNDAFMGKMSGSSALLNSYYSLVNGWHLVHPVFSVICFLLYLLTFCMLMSGNSLWSFIFDKMNFQKNLLYRVLVSFIGYAFLYNLIKVIGFYAFNTYYLSWIPIAFFTLVDSFSPMFKHS